VAGPDPADYLARAQKFADAGIDGIAFLNGSPELEKFIGFAAQHLIPAIHALNVAT